MEEEVFTGIGELKSLSSSRRFSSTGNENKAVSEGSVRSPVKLQEAPGEGRGDQLNEVFAESEYFHSLFFSCGPNEDGLVQVSRLLNVFRELLSVNKTFETDFGPNNFEAIDALKAVLDPMDVNPLISSNDFISCVKGCVGLEPQCYPVTPTSSNPGSIASSPARRHVEDSTDMMNKVSELEYQLRNKNQENINLLDQVSVVEEEKSSLLMQKNTLEKRLALSETHVESLLQKFTESEDTKKIILSKQKETQDLQGRVNFLERENGELVLIKNDCVQESENLSNQLQILETTLEKKMGEVDNLRSELQKESKRSTAFRDEKEREIQELKVQNYALKSQIDSVVAQKQQLESTISILEYKLNKSANNSPKTSKRNSVLADGPLEIESDDDSSNGIDGIPIDGSGIDNDISPSHSPPCSICSSLKDSLRSEITAVMSKKDLLFPLDELELQPESDIRKKIQQTFHLVKKFKMDLQRRTTAPDNIEEANDAFLSTQTLHEMSSDDLISVMNSELSQLQESFRSQATTSTQCDATVSKSNVSSSTQTDFKLGNNMKKGAIFLLICTCLMFGLPKLLQFQNARNVDGIPLDIASVFSKYGSMTHYERPII